MYSQMMRASFWEKQKEKIKCLLCPHECLIPEGGTGLCRTRKNEQGILYSLNYGQISALALDPIEKKPLRHFKSGSMVLSAGSWGCNLACEFCQNWQIARECPSVEAISPQRLVEIALQVKDKGNVGIAYTYNEPLVSYEFIKDCAALVKQAGLDNILVSNGYVNSQPLLELAPLLDAVNIDLKAFNEKFYREICGGSLAKVKDSIMTLADFCHVEVTTLIIPGLNDSAEEIERIAKWLAGIDSKIVYHITRYFPSYKMSRPQTPKEKIFALKKVADKFLQNVYAGNI